MKGRTRFDFGGGVTRVVEGEGGRVIIRGERVSEDCFRSRL